MSVVRAPLAAAVVLAVVALLLLSGCGLLRRAPQSADDAVRIVGVAVGARDAESEIPRAVKALDEGFPVSTLTPAQRAARAQTLQQADDRLLALATARVDTRARAADQQIAASAPGIVTGTLRAQPVPVFRQRMEAITQDLIKGQACSALFDAAVPKRHEEDDSTVREVAEEGVAKLVAASFNRAGVLRIVDTYYWGKDVIEKGDRVATAVEDDPGTVAQYTRPPVSRATIAYTRYCYAPPR